MRCASVADHRPGARWRLVAEAPLQRRACREQLAQPCPVGVQPVDVREHDPLAGDALGEQQVQPRRRAAAAGVDPREDARAGLQRRGGGRAQHALLDRRHGVPGADEPQHAGAEAAARELRLRQATRCSVRASTDSACSQGGQSPAEVGAGAGDHVHARRAGDRPGGAGLGPPKPRTVGSTTVPSPAAAASASSRAARSGSSSSRAGVERRQVADAGARASTRRPARPGSTGPRTVSTTTPSGASSSTAAGTRW